MTDNDIIKAVECCIGNTKCGECPMFRTPNCMNKVFGYALDIINRQKAEVERLKEELDGETVKNMRLGHEIEQWKEEANRYQNLWCEAVKDIQTAKADTIKGVADRLENGEYGQYDWEYKEFIYTQSDIDSLLAEMTEGRENG